VIRTGDFDVHSAVDLNVEFSESLGSRRLDGIRGKIERFKEAMSILNHLWPQDWSPDILIEAAQTGDFLTLYPDSAMSHLTEFQSLVPRLRQAILKLSGDKAVIRQALNHLASVLTPGDKTIH
jgi:hypothetical protein